MSGIVFDLNSFVISAVTACIAFVITVLLMPGFIRLIVRLKFGQEVRDLGPAEHLKKRGTPTMGGAVFLAAAVIATVAGTILNGRLEPETLRIVFLMLGFGLIGAADDYLKIRRHDSDGLSPAAKISMQLVLSLILILSVYYARDMEGGLGHVLIPFTGNFDTALIVRMPLAVFIAFALCVILGTDNGVNFTDGLDGLCASVTSAAAAMFVMMGIVNLRPGIAFPAAGILGGLLGFLVYNAYPARIFMGDTGSLALGGFVAGAAVTSGTELYVPIFGFIYLIEVLSVIIQVTYFKHSGGKRIFKMSPIHHHFELSGHSETRIVAVFTIITMILSTLTFIATAYIR